ncbi:MAG: hypothetical protein JWN73_283 [Betaproteobacteria bacterium]|nr:hypothetical protein [Betaproteobacteria bacterium]
MAFCRIPAKARQCPSIDGKPLFIPSRTGTLLVGIALLGCAALVGATAGFFQTSAPPAFLRWISYALALGLLARGIGDFRYVGLFKKVRGSSFARMDSRLYSPLCLLLAAGVTRVAAG